MPQQPLQVPVVQKPTPIVLDQLLVETSESNQALYDLRLEYGHYHPEQIKYPGHRLLKQGPNSYGRYQYIWGNDLVSQDSYNVAKQYAENANAYPIFARSYRVLRSDYLVTGPSTKGLAFTGIVAIKVTNGGTGFTKDFAITFTGGAGSGLSGTAIVNRGVIVRIEITNVGTGFTTAPTITFTNGSGTGAAATAIIQPTGAVLVEEKHEKLPEDDPYSSLYDRVILVYMTLPGPVVIISEEIDKDSGILVTKTRQLKLIASITPGVVITASTSVVETAMQGEDGIIANEVKTTVTASPYHDVTSAKITYATKPYEFPGYLLSVTEFVMVVDLYGNDIGHKKASADNVIITTREWWVIATAIPAIAYGAPSGNDVHVDQIIPGDIVLNGVPYRHVLHDVATRPYNGVAVTVPATIPSATEYYGGVSDDLDPFAPGTPPTWIGEDKVVEADIEYYKLVSDGLFKVTSQSVNMQ